MRQESTYGFSCDLTGTAHEEVSSLWLRLEERFGLRNVQAAVHPHLTFLVGECRTPELLPPALKLAAGFIPRLRVEIDGVDTFGGEVVYLKVRRSPELEAAHAVITSHLREAGIEIWPYYLAASWIPHVTLAAYDLNPENLPEVLADLNRRRTTFETVLTSLDLVHVVQPRHHFLARMPLQSASSENL